MQKPSQPAPWAQQPAALQPAPSALAAPSNARITGLFRDTARDGAVGVDAQGRGFVLSRQRATGELSVNIDLDKNGSKETTFEVSAHADGLLTVKRDAFLFRNEQRSSPNAAALALVRSGVVHEGHAMTGDEAQALVQSVIQLAANAGLPKRR